MKNIELFNEITNDLSDIIDLKLKNVKNNSNLLYCNFLSTSTARIEISKLGNYNTLDVFTYSSTSAKNIVCVEYHKNRINSHLSPFYTEEEFFIESLENNLVFNYQQYLNLIKYISDFKTHYNITDFFINIFWI